jgi:CrcB protein
MNDPAEASAASPFDTHVRAARPRLHPAIAVAVFLGGTIGAGLRHELAKAFPAEPGNVPWTTLTINLVGSFLLGVLLVLVVERWPPTHYVRPFAAIGILGAFTTFSTFAVEVDLLIDDGEVGIAAVYVASSLIGGLIAAYLGIVAGRAWPGITRRRS